MGDDDLLITEGGFLTEFLNQHGQRADRPFCFILGAGASRPSGIPAGGELAAIWLREMHEAEDFEGLTMDQWATPERMDISAFSRNELARFYPELYRRRYGKHEQGGYAFLESQMDGKEPSYGYSVLAYLLSETPHKVVVTTNFDNLVADALSIHSSHFPLVVGHDSLAQFAAVELRRPLVAKIHGALGFSPKSQPDDIETLPEGWRVALRRILERYTPIVIGYDGNDGSLMGFLEALPQNVPDRVLWCVYAPDAKPHDVLTKVSQRVRDYVRSRCGRLTPIRGFDELMARILSKLRERGSVPDLYERLKERARLRERAYDEQQRKLFEKTSPVKAQDEGRATTVPMAASDTALSAALNQIAESRKDKPWWIWRQEALAESDPEIAKAIYLKGIEALPNNADLLSSFAVFLESKRELDSADTYYQQALSANTKHVKSLAFYADFLNRYRSDYHGAGKLYERAVEAGAQDEYTFASYGDFLERARQDMDAAESMYLRAVNASDASAFSFRRYAAFLQEVRKDMNKAEQYYLRALAVEPENGFVLRVYADFLQTIRGDFDKAEEHYRRAVDADPNSVFGRVRYGIFLDSVRGDPDRAEEQFRGAIAVNSNDGFALRTYARFLETVRQNIDLAEEYYRAATEAEPNDPLSLTQYSSFLRRARNDEAKAAELDARTAALAP